MAKENISLKVSRSDYERMLEKVKGQANQLDIKISRFTELKYRCGEFIDESDDNFEGILTAVDKYIVACHKEHALIEETIKELTRVLNDMDRFSDASREVLDNVKETAENAISIAVDKVTSSLVDILK